MRWVVVDAPLDSSGRARGEQRAPAALRAAGLVRRIGAADAGIVDAVVDDPVRDPATGLIGADQVRRASDAVAAAVAGVIATGRQPLVVGGDCAILLGVALGLPADTGLWFLDGHADFMDGRTSPTGEGADMDLSIVTGHGPDVLGRSTPLVDPGRVHLIGHRPSQEPTSQVEANRVDPRIHQLPAAELRSRGAGTVGRELAADGGDGPAWLHLDLDVLDPGSLPAVTYPEPGGLDWDDLVALVGPLVRSGRLVGASVADFNADEDPDGRHAERVVEALATVLSP